MTAPDVSQHWDAVYGRHAMTEVSWHEADPSHSLALIAATGVTTSAPVIDFSSEALSAVRDRLGAHQQPVTLLEQDVRILAHTRRYSIWHDRAVLDPVAM